jgi:hypothetical protein
MKNMCKSWIVVLFCGVGTMGFSQSGTHDFYEDVVLQSPNDIARVKERGIRIMWERTKEQIKGRPTLNYNSQFKEYDRGGRILNNVLFFSDTANGVLEKFFYHKRHDHLIKIQHSEGDTIKGYKWDRYYAHFDAEGNMVEKKIYLSKGGTRTKFFTYDTLGTMLSVTTKDYKFTVYDSTFYTYDKNFNLVEKRTFYPNGKEEYWKWKYEYSGSNISKRMEYDTLTHKYITTEESTWDSYNNMQTYIGYVNGEKYLYKNFTHSDDEVIIEVRERKADSSFKESVITRIYKKNRLVEEKEIAKDKEKLRKYTCKYDSDGRKLSEKYFNKGKLIKSFENTYDNEGNITKRFESLYGNSVTRKYRYELFR